MIIKMEFKDITDKRLLAKFLGIKYKELTYILYSKRTENLYQTFEIPKKDGKMRCINAPQEPLKYVQRNLAKQLISIQEKYYLETNNIIQGFTKKRDIISNGSYHRNKRYILNLDLENFFDSFHFGRVKGYFQKNQYFMLNSNVATCLANIACYKGKLPQGSPSSPVITNLICSILDRRLATIAQKYRMTYTRYADDLTFSTNRRDFLENKDELISELYAVIDKSGFKVNRNKTRVLFWNSRQEVTGLVVNKKISVKREFYKETRAMLDHLYKGLIVEHNGIEVSLQQIEGRLSFINQIDKYNNKHGGERKNVQKGMNGREKEYQQFLFYKYFFCPSKPVIVTEGKTDPVYIRSALQKFYIQYPKLIRKKEDGSFEYLITFLKRTSRLEFFLGIQQDGANAMKNIYNEYVGNNQYPNLYEPLRKYGLKSSNPVILLFDNETVTKRPLKDFLNHINNKSGMDYRLWLNIHENLYLATIPLVKEQKECEIEDLFSDEVLSHEIDGKYFDRKGKDGEKSYSKQIFASYIAQNISSIDFTNFVPLLDALNEIVKN